VGIGIIQLHLHLAALELAEERGLRMRATILAAVLTVGALSLVTPGRASSLAGLSAHPSAASSGLSRRRGRRATVSAQVPLSASLLRALRLRPYQYRFWQYYAPICYPL